MKTIKIYLPIALIAFVLFSTSCSKNNRNIKGSGPVVEQEFNLPPVSGAALAIDANVVVTQGDSQTVIIRGQQNIIDNIEKQVSADGVWGIGYYNSVKNHAGITIYITTPHFDYASISGSGMIETTNYFSDTANVYTNISGSGDIILMTHANMMESVISGSGNMTLYGTANTQSINISGSGSISGFLMEAYETYIKISGSGSCRVNVEHYMDVNISGSGSIYYKGNPEMNVNISGSGALINSN